MKTVQNTTQEKTKFNSYVYGGQCIYNIEKKEVAVSLQIKTDKK